MIQRQLVSAGDPLWGRDIVNTWELRILNANCVRLSKDPNLTPQFLGFLLKFVAPIPAVKVDGVF